MAKNSKKYFDLRDHYNTKNNEIMEDIAIDFDDAQMPNEIMDIVVDECKDPNYVLLTHATSGLSKERAFREGLTIAGGNKLSYTTRGYDEGKKYSIVNIATILKNAAHYKEGKGNGSRCLLIKIPRSAVEYVPGESKAILFQRDDNAEESGGLIILEDKKQTQLLPEYILGSIEYDENHKMKEFVKNPNYTNEHVYHNNGLVCSEELIYNYRKTKNIPYNSITDEEINEIISQENELYMQNHQNDLKEKRSVDEVKDYSKKGLILSKFNEMALKIKANFMDITKDNVKGDKNNVERQ